MRTICAIQSGRTAMSSSVKATIGARARSIPLFRAYESPCLFSKKVCQFSRPAMNSSITCCVSSLELLLMIHTSYCRSPSSCAATC